MNKPQYELAQNIFSLICIVFIIIQESVADKSANFVTTWMVGMILLNALFLLELLTDFLVFGFVNAYRQHFRAWIESICQVVNLFLIVEYLPSVGDATKSTMLIPYFYLVILIRALKVLSLMQEVTSLRMIIETLKNLLVPILHMTSVLGIIYYLFALVGMCLFGGLVHKNLDYPLVEGPYTVPANFHLVNFNDFFSSIVTLFTLMVVNNWMISVSQCVFVTAGMYDKNMVRLYFFAFYYFSVIVGINLVVAYVLDMYASTERLEADRLKTLEMMEDEISGARLQKQLDERNEVDQIKDQMAKLTAIIEQHKKVNGPPQLIPRESIRHVRNKSSTSPRGAVH